MPTASETVQHAVGRLVACCGAGAVLSAPADLAPYLGDLLVTHPQARICVFRPASTEMLSRGLAALGALDLDLVPRGGGSGLAGGATPATGRPVVVVCTQRMRAIRKLDPLGRLMVVEAGVVLAQAQEAAAAAGLQLGLTHGGAGSATIGGSVATNAGGANVIGFGMARDQILGVEAVLADGTVIGRASELWKDNTGYHLGQMLAGSEGTLAFVTTVTLKLRAGPIERMAALVAVETPAQAQAVLQLARGVLGDAITAAELVSAASCAFARSSGTAPEFLPDAPWLLLIEAERTSAWFDLAGGFAALVEQAFEDGLAHDGLIAANETQRRAFWHLREGVAEAMDLWRGPILRTDCAVPVANVPAFIAQVTAQAEAIAPHAQVLFFGHVGDGNIHVNFLAGAGADLPEALGRMVEDTALSLDGSVSAEHGIGLHKRAALRRMKSAAELGLMARIKTAFDPGGRLNPGKILARPDGGTAPSFDKGQH